MDDTPNEWDELKCLLPVVRQLCDDEHPERESYIDACGAELFVVGRESRALLVGGPCEVGNWWRVECLGGHVLFTPDDEGNGHDIPFVFEEFHRAYKYITDLIYPVQWVGDLTNKENQ